MSPTEIAGVGLGVAGLAGLLAAGVAGLTFKRRGLSRQLFVAAFLAASLGWCLREAADVEARRRAAEESIDLLAAVSADPRADSAVRARSKGVAASAITGLAAQGSDRFAWFSLGFALASALAVWAGTTSSRQETTPRRKAVGHSAAPEPRGRL